MRWTRLRQVDIKDFRSFVGSHTVTFPEAGMVLVRGVNGDTGGGSGSGKSSFLLAIQHLTKDCPLPSTELQSWHVEAAPEVRGLLDAPEGAVEIQRGKAGAKLKVNGAAVKGGSKIVEPRLDEVIGLDPKLRRLVTYRAQRTRGLFLSMSDPEKKEFLTKVLDVEKYEAVAAAAEQAVKDRAAEVERFRGQVDVADAAMTEAAGLVGAEPELRVTEESVRFAEEHLARCEREVEGYRAEIAKVKDYWTAKLAEDTAALREEIGKAPAAGPDTAALTEKLEGYREKQRRVERHDAEERAKYDAAVSELRLKVSRLEAAAAQLPRLEAELDELHRRRAELERHACPECGQTWHDASAKKRLEEIVARGQEVARKVLDAKATAQGMAALREELAGLKAPVPHPIGRQLTNAINETTAKIAEVRGAHAASVDQRVAELRAEVQKIRENYMATVVQESYAHTEALKARLHDVEVNRAVLADMQRQVAQHRADVQARAARVTAHNNAAARFEAAALSLEKAEAALALEQDVVAAAGKKGFLGAIFDEVLGEVADATNDLLARVANVRDVTVRFDSDVTAKTTGNTQKRITPVMTVRGREVSFAAGLSGGMQSAVELAVDLGVGDVVARRRGAFPGWLILDEAFDGLGPVEKESCMDMLSIAAADRLVLVVDHASEFQGMFQQVIEIRYGDGRSEIV